MSDAARVIDEVVAGEGLGLTAAAKLVPPYRGSASNADPTTIWRWMRDGYKMPDGTVIKLESAKLANRWLTSRPALARFIQRTTEATLVAADPAPIPPRSESRRAKRAAAASAQLEKMGA